MNEQMILLPVTIGELKSLVADAVNNSLLNSSVQTDLQKPDIINRTELCKRLHITPPTAIRWGKKNKIPSFYIGNSVRYNYTEVLKALQKNNGGMI